MGYLTVIQEVFEEVVKATRRIVCEDGAFTPLGRGAHGDITYRIDRVVEEAAVRAVKRRLPGSLIISEEAGVIGGGDGGPLVLIDPVDGSTNASRSVPFYSSAVAILDGYRFSDVSAAGVIDLVNGDMIASEKGGGVTLNGEPTHPSEVRDIDRAYVNVNMRLRDGGSVEGGWLASLLDRVRYPRFMGSAALETAYVAVGRSDAYVQMLPTLRPFDCIGSLFMVKEAGGFVRCLNLDLEEVDLRRPVRLAYVAACCLEVGDSILSLRV